MSAPEQQETRNPADSPSGELPGPLPAATATDGTHRSRHRAPEQQATPEQPDLRQRLVDALLAEDADWGHNCGFHRTPTMAGAFATAVLAVVEPELAAKDETIASHRTEIHTTADALPQPIRIRLLGHAITIDSMATDLDQQDTQ